MSDLRFLDELEAELERVARQRTRRRPRRRVFRLTVPAVAIVAIVVVVLSLSGNGNPGPSLLARAYAATSSRGQILFYETTSYSPGEDKPDQYAARDRSMVSVWSSGNTVRTTERQVIGGAPGHRFFTLFSENVISGDRFTGWESMQAHAAGTITNTILPQRSCTMQDALVSSSCGTPLEAVRQLYRTGALHLANTTTFHGEKVDVLTERTPGPPPSDSARASTLLTKVLVNTRTFTPVEIKVTSTNFTDTATFSGFTRLPLTAANKRLLQMSPHPGASVTQLPPGGIIVNRSTTTPIAKLPSTSTSVGAPANTKSAGKVALINEIGTGVYENTAGTAGLVRSQGQDGLVMNVSALPPSSPGARYGVWLLNASTDSDHFLGYIASGLKNGHTSVKVALPPSALKRYESVELTIEHSIKTPSRPGKAVLRGKLP